MWFVWIEGSHCLGLAGNSRFVARLELTLEGWDLLIHFFSLATDNSLRRWTNCEANEAFANPKCCWTWRRHFVYTIWYHRIYFKYGLKYGAAFIHTISKTDQAFLFFWETGQQFPWMHLQQIPDEEGESTSTGQRKIVVEIVLFSWKNDNCVSYFFSTQYQKQQDHNARANAEFA